MTNLLDLPSELLNLIIHFVVVTSRNTPLDGWRSRSPYEYITVQNVVCHSDQGSPDALSLLLTNRKLLSETRQYLDNAQSIARLDLAMVDFHWLWPTWRNLPVRSGVIDQVVINFVPCCTEGERYLQTADSPGSIDLASSFEDRDILRKLISDFVLDWIGHLLPKLARETRSAVVSQRIPRIGELLIYVDPIRCCVGNIMLSQEEVPLRKIDGLAHLDFRRLYPIELPSTFEQMQRLDTSMPFGTAPSALLREQITKGVKVMFSHNGLNVWD